MSAGNQMIEAAITYAKMGLSVIPLNGKVPFFENWPSVATTDIPTIQRWFQQTPNANLGVATGKKSNVFVVDIDPRHGGDDSWQHQLAIHSGTFDTWQDVTGGGGLHVWFRYPNFPVKSCAGIFPGIDIRGDGGQVVVPPSIHPDTHRAYLWDGGKEIQDQQIAESPVWLLEFLQPKNSSQATKVDVSHGIPKGVQHQTLLSLAGQLRRMGLSPEEIFPSLMLVNQNRCEEPGPEKNIRQIAQSMAKYQPGERALHVVANRLWAMESRKTAEVAQQTAVLKTLDAYALLKQPPQDISMVVDDCLHVGCTILAGAPKSGKSWLTLGMGIAVATGGMFIGAKDILKPGRVAYWALEESSSRTARRLKQLVAEPSILLQNLEFLYALRPMFSGGLEDISLYCEQFHPTMIVIDTLMAFVTGDRGSRKDVFRDDYREIKALSELSAKYEVALVVVHHTNKIGGSGVEAVAGTHGVTAAADCIWIMERQGTGRALLGMRGREVEDQSFLMELDIKGLVGWHVLEQGDDVALSGERQIILEVLREGGPKSPKALAAEIGKSPLATRQLLFKMVQKGTVTRHENGNYTISREPQRHWSDNDAR